MLKKQVIQPANSPWASPTVLLKKKDGILRFCVNYQGLKSVTKSNWFPLPLIGRILYFVGSRPQERKQAVVPCHLLSNYSTITIVGGWQDISQVKDNIMLCAIKWWWDRMYADNIDTVKLCQMCHSYESRK